MSVDLYNADCFDILPKIETGSVDMVLCDLPYGVTNNEKDKALDLQRLWPEYKRIVKENGCIALFAQGMFYVDLIDSNREMFRYDLVWDKEHTTGFLNANRMPLRRHEQIAIFYSKLPTYNPQMVAGKPNHDQGTKRYLEGRTNQNYGKFNEVATKLDGMKHPTSILAFRKPHPSVAFHRTEKPVPLLEWLIRTYTNESETVLDNCMGSGTTGIACVRTNRNFIGIEMDPKYYDIAKMRIDGVVAEMEGKEPAKIEERKPDAPETEHCGRAVDEIRIEDL